MVGALTAVLAKSKRLFVALVQNDNGFSRSVCAGARDFIAKTQNLFLSLGGANVEVVRGAISDADKAWAIELMDMKPDVVAVCGHSRGHRNQLDHLWSPHALRRNG